MVRTAFSTQSDWRMSLTRNRPLGPFVPSNQFRTARSFASVMRAMVFTADGPPPNSSLSAESNRLIEELVTMGEFARKGFPFFD
jgi:hypothetical protein